MKSFEKYIKRVKMSGRSSTESIINNSIRDFERNFTTSPSYYQVDIDGSIVDTIINKTKDPHIKQIHFRHNYEPEVGSIITFQDKRYLLFETDRDEIYSFGKMEFCNSVLKIQTNDKNKVVIGYDRLNRPIYDTQIESKDEPCVVRDRYYSTNENAQLPLPDGKLDIYLKYQESPSLEINNEISLYNKNYKIADISYVNVIDGAGIMRIHAERRDNRDA